MPGAWTLHWLPGRGRRVELTTRRSPPGISSERFRLFFIIVLGETVLATGSAFAGRPFALERLLALTIGFAGTVALWWCNFERAEALGAQSAERAADAAQSAREARGRWR